MKDLVNEKGFEVLEQGGSSKDLLSLGYSEKNVQMLVRFHDHTKKIQPHLSKRCQEKFRKLGYKALLFGRLIDLEEWDKIENILKEINPDITYSELYRNYKNRLLRL